MMEVQKHTCILTLLTFFSATYASSRYWKFSKDFGGDCKSTRSVIETTSGPGLTTRRCGARCMDDIQCNGFNFVSGSVPQCTLIQGITESVDIQAETGTVFYQQQGQWIRLQTNVWRPFKYINYIHVLSELSQVEKSFSKNIYWLAYFDITKPRWQFWDGDFSTLHSAH